MSKRRLLADSGDEEEEAGRAPQRPDKANGKQPPAKVAAKGAAVASANHLHSPLVQLLEKCGLKVSSNGATPHSGDSGSIRVSLERELRHCDAARMKVILTDLKSLLSQPAFLLSALQPITPSTSEGTRADAHSVHLGARDESLVKLFLNVPALQSVAMETLLEQMPLLQHQSVNPEEPLSVLRLALAQFRWLDITLVDAHSLATKLVELLNNSPDATLQREVISLIPDVIDDSTQGVYVEALAALAAADSSLRLTIIDTLGNLNLASKFHEDVRRLSLDALHGAHDDEIPVLVRFIMQSADTVEELRPLMRELRSNIAPSLQSSSPQGLVLEAMKTGFQMNKHAVTAYLKELGTLAAGDARPIDVWFLIALLSLAHHRKAGESAIKKLAGAHLLSPGVLREAIKGHAQTLQPYFSVLLNLSDRLIRSSETAERDVGVELAVLCFRQFVSGGKQVGYHQQEVIGSLVSHIGSSVRAEVDAALTALSRLCVEDPATVTSYASTLKGILEYLDGLSDSEVCRTFDILSRLSLSKDKRSVEIADALEMLIHKHLASNTLRDRRVGVLGAVAILRLPASTPELARRASTLLSQLLLPARRAHSQPLALEFAYDELVAVGRAGGPLAQEIISALTATFQTTFLTFGTEDSVASASEQWWNAFDGATVEAVLNIMPMVQAKRVELAWLAAQFRLVMGCCSEQVKTDEWSALVGCPVQMFSREHLQAADFAALTPAAQADCCAALFCAHGWFRELLNGFTALATDATVRRMLLERLASLPELEATLTRLAAASKWQPPSGEDKPVATAGPRGRGRPRKNDDEKADEGAAASLERFFRPLDPSVASLLIYCMPGQDPDDDTLHTQKAKPPPTLSTAAIRTIISAVLAPLLTAAPGRAPPSARKVTMRELDMQRRLPSAISVIQDCVVPTLPALRSHCTHFLKEMESALADERAALLSVLALSFSLLERAILLAAPEPALQFQVLAAWHGGADRHVARDELERAVLSDLADWAERVGDLATAVAVLNAALALDPLTTATAASAAAPRRPAVRASLSKIAEALLANEELAKAKARPEHLRLLLSVWVRYSDDALTSLFHVSSSILPSCAAQEVANSDGAEARDQTSQGFPFLKLATFPVFYRAALQELSLAAVALTATLEADATGDSLAAATQAATTFQALIELLKAHHSSRVVQSAALRSGKAVVDAALRWFPALSRLFGVKPAGVQAVVRALQQGSRPLQNLCADGKAKRDAALVSLVPLTRKSLETLVYKIKALCAANSLDPSAYRVANLRHKTVSGAEVSSQAPAADEEPEPKRKRKSKKRKSDEAKEDEAAEGGEEEGKAKAAKDKGSDDEREHDEARSGEVSESQSSDKEEADKDGDEEEEEDADEDEKPASPKVERRRKRVVSDGEEDV